MSEQSEQYLQENSKAIKLNSTLIVAGILMLSIIGVLGYAGYENYVNQLVTATTVNLRHEREIPLIEARVTVLESNARDTKKSLNNIETAVSKIATYVEIQQDRENRTK